MDDKVAASPEAIKKLNENIFENIKNIEKFNEQLSEKLLDLGFSFRDSGFKIISNHIESTKNNIDVLIPTFHTLLGNLDEYANHLIDSRNEIKENNHGVSKKEIFENGTKKLNKKKEAETLAILKKKKDEDDAKQLYRPFTNNNIRLSLGKTLAVPAAVLGFTDTASASVPDPIVRPVNNNPAIIQPLKQPLDSFSEETLEKPVEVSINEKDWVWNDDMTEKTYDHPEETGKTLNYRQGRAVKGFWGTCGLVSISNVLKMGGIDVSEKELIEDCSKENFFGRTFCHTGDPNWANNGGTTTRDIRYLLEKNGLPANKERQTVESIADAVESGKGVIIVVKAEELWQTEGNEGLHAVTVHSVTRDSNNNLTGFWITDSGASFPEPSTYYTKEHIDNSLAKKQSMIVTKNRIRTF